MIRWWKKREFLDLRERKMCLKQSRSLTALNIERGSSLIGTVPYRCGGYESWLFQDTHNHR